MLRVLSAFSGFAFYMPLQVMGQVTENRERLLHGIKNLKYFHTNAHARTHTHISPTIYASEQPNAFIFFYLNRTQPVLLQFSE
jgi:hypothetical protein